MLDVFNTGLVAQLIRRLTTDQEIARSNPAETDFVYLPMPHGICKNISFFRNLNHILTVQIINLNP